MTTTISPPVRIAALVGLAAALALGGMSMLLGHGRGSASSSQVAVAHHSGQVAKKAAPSTAIKHGATSARPATKPVANTTAKSAPHVVVRPKAPQKPAAEVAALAAGLPVRLARALGRQRIVVVAITNPQAEVDGIAFAEARAGAALAGVGFVPLNVLSTADVGTLTQHLGAVLADPSVLVYTRPGRLVARINGFVDKETVAQAAQNAAHGS